MLSMEELAKECVKIEKAGGDVLDYLREQGKLSPRGSWWRIQREVLGRKESQMTDGHGNPEKKYQTRRSMEENSKTVIEALQEKRSPVQALREVGYKTADQTYRDVKAWTLDHFPEYEDLFPNNLNQWMAENRKRKNDPIFKARAKKAEVTTSEKLPLEAGKNYELSVAEKPEVQKVINKTVKCELHNGFVPLSPEWPDEKKITEPLTYDGFVVRCVSHYQFGQIFFDEKHDCISWTSKNGEEVMMKKEEWIAFARNLPRALRVLGVDA